MPQSAQTHEPLTRTAVALAPGGIYLFACAALAFGAGVIAPDPDVGLVFVASAATLAVLAVLLKILAARAMQQRTSLHAQIAAFVAEDAAPSFTTDPDGAVGYQNRAGMERFGARTGQTLARSLEDVFANPSAVLARLQNKAQTLGAAREDLVTRRGHVRLSVHRIGEEGFLWRLEEMAEGKSGTRGGDAISLPMLTVSKTGTILFMNEALRRIIGERVRTLDRIFSDLPLRSGEEHEVMTPSGPMRTVVAELIGSGGRAEIYLLPISTGRVASHDPVAFETLPVPLMRLAADGEVVATNRAARGLIGEYDAGTVMSDIVEGLGRPVNDWLRDALAGRAERKPEVLRVKRGEHEVFLQVTLSRVIEDGRAGLVAVLSDATQLKTLEAQFVQSQKMQAIGQLAGGVAHDFNNLLTAISGHCDLLMLRHDKGDPDYSDLDQISQNANRAASLVGQLLAFSRKQTLKPKVIDLRDTLADLTHLLNRLVGEKVHLSLHHDPDLRLLRADKRQLEQVIMNLVVNARDAMPGGGEIRIETENVSLSTPMKRDRVELSMGEYVVVRVIDEGVGIPADKIGKIFEPFYTTKRTGEGTGLGLSTAYGIVKQTGGYIFCDSVQGSGTSFTLFFPAHDMVQEVEAAPPPAPVQIEVVGNETATVLLVEDEAPVRAFASRALKLRGYTVYEAESAEEALEILEDEALSVDIFVTDVIMPGMDGPTWVREALKLRPHTKVIFMSGYAEDVFQDGRPPLTHSIFLPKPFSLTDLTATVQNQLEREIGAGERMQNA